MGYMAHSAVVMTTYEDPDGPFGAAVEAIRAQLPERWKVLLVGPITTPINAYEVWALLPDGSKEGWPDSDEGDQVRARLAALCRSHDVDFVDVRFGGDDPDMAQIEDHTGSAGEGTGA